MKDINQAKKSKNNRRKDIMAMAVVLIAAAIVLFIFPQKAVPVLTVSKNYLLELILVLPAVMIIIGLFSVWIPDRMVVKYMGYASGTKGIVLSLALGMLPTGPLYIAFPMAAALLNKGAKRSNIIIFISAWACIKLPQELIEIQFLGLKFTLLRLGLTIVFVIIMGIIIEKLIELTDKKDIKVEGKK
ncbi:MAG: permease [Actinomycetia bacterium]|nr:permease [Actinomycetes bacterium]